jgi:protein-S-isoprenylcysteine O-methyltransferase Ste14
MNGSMQAYGLWLLVVLNVAVFLMFAYSFTKPRTRLEWRSFGAFAAFVVALFTEMYGFPLTVYLLSGWLGTRFPALDILTHDSGHLWNTLLRWRGDPHTSPLHLVSYVFLGGGFVLLSSAWPPLYRAQQSGQLASTGPYAHIRHPQYVAFIAIMIGFLLQWPTLLTLVMFPILVLMYVRLATREERQVRARFPDEYERYAASTPRFFPRIRGRRSDPSAQPRGAG